MFELFADQAALPGQPSGTRMVHRNCLDENGITQSIPLFGAVADLPQESIETQRFSDIEFPGIITEDVQPRFIRA